jgi:hypothetical protein
MIEILEVKYDREKDDMDDFKGFGKMSKVIIKQGDLNWDDSGRAYPDNPEKDENWDCIWENKGKYYKIVGSVNHAEWDRVDVKERELTYKERYDIWFRNNYETGMEYCLEVVPDFDNEYYEETPTKLITITYKDKTIESHE